MTPTPRLGTPCGRAREHPPVAPISASEAVNRRPGASLRAVRHAVHSRYAPAWPPAPVLFRTVPIARLGGAPARGAGRMSVLERDVILRAADVAKWLHVSPRQVL